MSFRFAATVAACGLHLHYRNAVACALGWSWNAAAVHAVRGLPVAGLPAPLCAVAMTPNPLRRLLPLLPSPADQQPGLLSGWHHPDNRGCQRHADCLGPCQLPPPGHCLGAPRPDLELGVQPRGGQPAGLWRGGQHCAHLERHAGGGSSGSWRGSASGGQAAGQRGGGSGSGTEASEQGSAWRQWGGRRGSGSSGQQRVVQSAADLEDQADARFWPAVHNLQPAAGQRRAHAAAAAARGPQVRGAWLLCRVHIV